MYNFGIFKQNRYKRGMYKKYRQNRNSTNGDNVVENFRNNNNTYQESNSIRLSFNNDVKKSSLVSSNFYKSRRRGIKKNKTVRFSDNLEQKCIIDNNNNESEKNMTNNNDDWDITISFEELV
jgi:hypothetical protein